MSTKALFLGFAVVLIAIAAFFIWWSDATIPVTATPTPDQIFTEVSNQFGFTRDDVLYFSIYGTDRVQYNSGDGLTFAYKDGGSWHISGPVGSQEVPLCSLLNDVPEKYRQACYDQNMGENRYIANNDNANYPSSEAVRYIQTL